MCTPYQILELQRNKLVFVHQHNMDDTNECKTMDQDISNNIMADRYEKEVSFDVECMSEPNHCCTKGRILKIT